METAHQFPSTVKLREMPGSISNHEVKITPVQDLSSFVLYLPTNLVKKDERLLRINTYVYILANHGKFCFGNKLFWFTMYTFGSPGLIKEKKLESDNYELKFEVIRRAMNI